MPLLVNQRKTVLSCVGMHSAVLFRRIRLLSVLRRCWLGDRKGITPVGGNHLTGALHELQLSPPPPSSLAPIQSRMETLVGLPAYPGCSGKHTSNKCCCSVRLSVRPSNAGILSKQIM